MRAWQKKHVISKVIDAAQDERVRQIGKVVRAMLAVLVDEGDAQVGPDKDLGVVGKKVDLWEKGSDKSKTKRRSDRRMNE